MTKAADELYHTYSLSLRHALQARHNLHRADATLSAARNEAINAQICFDTAQYETDAALRAWQERFLADLDLKP